MHLLTLRMMNFIRKPHKNDKDTRKANRCDIFLSILPYPSLFPSLIGFRSFFCSTSFTQAWLSHGWFSSLEKNLPLISIITQHRILFTSVLLITFTMCTVSSGRKHCLPNRKFFVFIYRFAQDIANRNWYGYFIFASFLTFGLFSNDDYRITLPKQLQSSDITAVCKCIRFTCKENKVNFMTIAIRFIHYLWMQWQIVENLLNCIFFIIESYRFFYAKRK